MALLFGPETPQAKAAVSLQAGARGQAGRAEARERSQIQLHEEFLEEQRTRKTQYEATQKVQAVVKGKAARAEVEAKKVGIAAVAALDAALPPEPVAEPAAEEAPAEPSG